jgi:perosamine synthetase
MISVYEPYSSTNMKKYVNKAIDSSWISSNGEFLEKAEESLKEICGVKYALLVNNGTAATHLVSRSLYKFIKDYDRILIPSACYIAAYNSLIYDNKSGSKIECVDLDEQTWNMKLENITDRDVVFAVHNLGNIINIPELVKRTGCVTVEDNCEGFFGRYEDYNSGSRSLCSSLSFYGNKNITCGEGGAFITDDKNVYDFANKLRGQGQGKTRFIHDELGYNYRMTNIQAAILLSQLENVDIIHEEKKRVFERYQKNLNSLDGVRVQKMEKNTEHSYWMFGVWFDNLDFYEEAREYFHSHGIDTRPMFYPHTSHAHLNLKGSTVSSTIINSKVVVFPSYPDLTDKQVDYISEKIKQFKELKCS